MQDNSVKVWSSEFNVLDTSDMVSIFATPRSRWSLGMPVRAIREDPWEISWQLAVSGIGLHRVGTICKLVAFPHAVRNIPKLDCKRLFVPRSRTYIYTSLVRGCTGLVPILWHRRRCLEFQNSFLNSILCLFLSLPPSLSLSLPLPPPFLPPRYLFFTFNILGDTYARTN